MSKAASRPEIVSVYTAGVIQGVALVTFPAASGVFTGGPDYALSNQEYGGMFVPQAIMAVVASFLGAGLTRRIGTKRVYLLGLTANLAAMTLLVCSRVEMHDHVLAYIILLAATACLGAGFGFTVPSLNTLAALFFPQGVEKAVLALNALLGLGTMLAPILMLLFARMGVWWGMPILVAVAILGLLVLSRALPLEAAPSGGATTARDTKIPARFWIFALFALLYGVCETLNGNWASVYMGSRLGASAALSSLALTVFWAAVTAGRVIFAALDQWIPSRVVFRTLPLVVGAAFIATANLKHGEAPLGIVAFAAAGLGCSALLPLMISFAQRELTSMATSVAGGLICAYQIGYGIAAFGVGPLQAHAGLALEAIYGATAAVAIVLAALSLPLAPRSSAAR
jgi:MFS family permease